MSTFNRRDLIKGFGYAGLVAATLMGRRDAHAADATSPRRLILFFTPGGFFPDVWRPSVSGATVDQPIDQVGLGSLFAGLKTPKYEALARELIVLDGINMSYVPRGVTSNSPYRDEHHNGLHAGLRGRPIVSNEPGAFPGMSIDRVIGQNLFIDRPSPLGLKNANLNVVLGNFGYNSTIGEACSGGSSLESVGIPALWDSVFKDFVAPTGGSPAPSGPSAALVRRYQRQNILANQTRAELATLHSMLGREEQVTLERHLDAMNAMTQQIAKEHEAASMQPSMPVASPKGTVPTKPGTYDAKRDLVSANAMAAKIIANAMAFDRVRVAVVHMFGHNNNESFWYPGATGAFHNGVHHSRNRAVSLSAMQTMVQMYFDIMNELKSIPEGSGTMLDSTTVATFSDMSNGDHGVDAGLYLVGGGGGWNAGGQRYFKSGRYMRVANRSNMDYLISLAHAMGVTETKNAAGARSPLTQIGVPSFNKGPLSGLTT